MPIFQPQSASSVPSFLINYMETNPDAESDASGWTVSKNTAAASIPDSGFVTSGTNITWTRSTSSPIQGNGSFALTKDAANRQGEQVYFPFSIRNGDQAKVLRMYVDYNVLSGTYADDDVIFYIFDVTNSTFIQPTPYKIKNTSLSSERMYLEFQTSYNSTSYRLIAHVSSTSASAYSLRFDNFVLGPNVRGYGSPTTDWISYTPTGSWVSNSTYTGKWRRVGDSIEYMIRISLSGAPTATGLTINFLPSGFTADTTKMLGTDASVFYGQGFTKSAGTSYVVVAQYSSATVMTVIIPNSASTSLLSSSAVTQILPATYANGDNVEIWGKVPIVGLSSSVVMSSDANTRITSFSAYRNSALTGLNPNSSAVQIIPDTSAIDTHGGFNTTTGKYTIKVAGQYEFTGRIRIAGTNVVANQYYLQFTKNSGATVLVLGQQLLASAGAQFDLIATTPPVSLVVGDTVEMYLFGVGNNSVSTLSASVGQTLTYFGGRMLSGPAQIAASEKMWFSAQRASTNQTVTSGSYQELVYNQSDTDSHSQYSTSTGRFTAQSAGTFHFDMSAQITMGATKANSVEIKILKNGTTLYAYGLWDDLINSGHYTYHLAANIPMVAGDYVSVFCQSTAQNVTFSSGPAGNFSGFRI